MTLKCFSRQLQAAKRTRSCLACRRQEAYKLAWRPSTPPPAASRKIPEEAAGNANGATVSDPTFLGKRGRQDTQIYLSSTFGGGGKDPSLLTVFRVSAKEPVGWVSWLPGGGPSVGRCPRCLGRGIFPLHRTKGSIPGVASSGFLTSQKLTKKLGRGREVGRGSCVT